MILAIKLGSGQNSQISTHISPMVLIMGKWAGLGAAIAVAWAPELGGAFAPGMLPSCRVGNGVQHWSASKPPRLAMELRRRAGGILMQAETRPPETSSEALIDQLEAKYIAFLDGTGCTHRFTWTARRYAREASP